MSLTGDLGDAAFEFVRASAERPTIEQIVDYLMENFDLAEYGENATRAYLRQLAKTRLSDVRRSDESQASLPGFHIPSAITVPINEGEVVYVASVDASQGEWRAHRMMKVANISRAVDELRIYDELTDELSRVWVAEPDLTVGQCIERLAS